MIVTKELKKAFKNAYSVCIFFNRTTKINIYYSKFVDGENLQIEKSFECKNEDKNDSDYSLPSNFNRAIFQFQGTSLHILAKLIKESDYLSFNAYDNCNQYTKKANLYNDTLWVSVYRESKKFNISRTCVVQDFKLDSGVTPNNSARPLQV